ncbi:Rab-3-interacting molecule unc-10 [Frankliniella fusca]|uniref:Rab-3-interacting molecule unc-10 n=1 Tax=Frankliniella fusca TaxID=407009 RepID=A0AAE1H327_9NEOP|nr:Rab-3-interacting molecule unc-10 [Frankliniella fusca]
MSIYRDALSPFHPPSIVSLSSIHMAADNVAGQSAARRGPMGTNLLNTMLGEEEQKPGGPGGPPGGQMGHHPQGGLGGGLGPQQHPPQPILMRGSMGAFPRAGGPGGPPRGVPPGLTPQGGMRPGMGMGPPVGMGGRMNGPRMMGPRGPGGPMGPMGPGGPMRMGGPGPPGGPPQGPGGPGMMGSMGGPLGGPHHAGPLGGPGQGFPRPGGPHGPISGMGGPGAPGPGAFGGPPHFPAGPGGPGVLGGPGGPHAPPPPAGGVPEVDLSHLSEEERAMIQNVMAKAQQLDKGETGPTINSRKELDSRGPLHQPDNRTNQFGFKSCSICHMREVGNGVGQECVECRSLTCHVCGALVPASHDASKNTEWMCKMCMKRTNVQPVPWQPPGQRNQPGVTSQQQQPWDSQLRRTGSLEREREYQEGAERAERSTFRESSPSPPSVGRPMAGPLAAPLPASPFTPVSTSSPGSPMSAQVQAILAEDREQREREARDREMEREGERERLEERARELEAQRLREKEQGRDILIVSRDISPPSSTGSEVEEEEDLSPEVSDDERLMSPAASVPAGSAAAPSPSTVVSSSQPPSIPAPALPEFYQTAIGPIPEEDEEVSSPTAPDGVSSLRRRHKTPPISVPASSAAASISLTSSAASATASTSTTSVSSISSGGGVYNTTMDDGRSHMGPSANPMSGTQSLPQSPRAQLRSQRSLDGALGGSLGGLTNAGRGSDLGRGRGTLGRPGSRESMFDSQQRDIVNSDFAPRNGISGSMDIDRPIGQGGTGMEQGLYGTATSMPGHQGGPLGALSHGPAPMGQGMSSMSGMTGLNNMIGNQAVGGVPGVSSTGMSGVSVLQGMGPYGTGLSGGTHSKTSTAVSTATTSGTSISGMLADFSRALGLGNTSPRPSPSEERPPLDPHDTLAALHPPPLYGSAGTTNTTTTPSMGGGLHAVHGLGATAGLSNPSGLSSAQGPVTSGLGGTPMSTPQGTPVGTPRGPRDQGGDSSDTMSETDSQKSLRNRRKLPPIPADQEAAPLPTKKRERKSHSADRFRSFSPLRQASLDGSSARSSSLMLTRPSASETNLRKITHGVEQAPRPGSALGLLQGSSVVSSTGLPVTASSLYASNQMSDLASVLPPDLRHLLGPGAGGAHSLHADSYSKTMPSYMQSLKEQLKEEMRADRRRLLSLDKERELRFRREREKFEALRDPLKRLEMQRKMASPVLSRSRKLRVHRRQLSDPKIHPPFSPITEDRDLENEYERGYLGFLHKPPYKSYEYESIDDGHRSEWDPSHSYLSTSYAAAGGALRETAINSVLDDDRYFSSSRSGMRRSSADVLASRGSLGRKPHRKPRSWHPSPYGSDEDDDAVFREEKKAKIKAEIARRRREIEVNDRLHEELVRLAKIRESAELGYDGAPGATTAVYASNELALSRHAAQVAAGVRHPATGAVGPSDYASSSVLKSIDELLLTDPMDYSHHRSRSPRRHHVPGVHPGVSEEDRSIERIASTFRTDDYTAGLYERLSDFSPLTDFTPHAMPLLPDMPTRSRKLLEDLGSSPITESVLALPQKGKYGSRLYAK